jgi:hypothetical protein
MALDLGVQCIDSTLVTFIAILPGEKMMALVLPVS